MKDYLHVIRDARKHIVDLRERLFRSHKYSTPLTPEDILVDLILFDSERFLDEFCENGNYHDREIVDGPCPERCKTCGRGLS